MSHRSIWLGPPNKKRNTQAWRRCWIRRRHGAQGGQVSEAQAEQIQAAHAQQFAPCKAPTPANRLVVDGEHGNSWITGSRHTRAGSAASFGSASHAPVRYET